MARATTVWEIPANGGEPQRLLEGLISSERSLEDWIEKHPELIEQELVVVARQMETGSGPLDLLCLDKGGRLVVIELKRGDAYRDALAQALDYTARIASMSYEDFEQIVDANRAGRGLPGKLENLLTERLPESADDWTPEIADPRIILAGTGADESLRRMVDYLSDRYGVPVNGVFFDVSTTASGTTLLVRTGVVSDEKAAKQGRRRGRGIMTSEQMVAFAEEQGTRALVQPLLDTWMAVTGREARAENRYWSLGARLDGRKVPACVYPFDDEDRRFRAWLWLSVERLAEDLGSDQAPVVRSIAEGGMVLEDGIWLNVSTEAEVLKATKWLQAAYSRTSA